MNNWSLYLIRLRLASKNLQRKRGEELWNIIDAELPEAVGAIANDVPRVQQFQTMFRKLPKSDQRCIKLWLAEEVDFRENVWYSSFSGKGELLNRKWLQICQQHLESVS